MSDAGTAATLRCPVCGARVRAVECGRCGADLTAFLAVELDAWRLRREGWRRLVAGDATAAAELAARSLELEDSASARRLAWLAGIVAAAS